MTTQTKSRGRPPTESKSRGRAAAGVLSRPPYRNALVVMTIALTLASLFAVSYSLALGRPTPHHIPAALVGPAGAPAVAALERVTGYGLQFEPLASPAVAEHAIDQQRVYAALVVDRSPPELLVASAAGTSVARVLEQAAPKASAIAKQPVTIRDVRPLPPKDPQGLVSFYVMLAATILGFVSMFQLRANASGMPLRGWLSCIIGLAVVGGLLLYLVTDPLLGALRGAFPELWVILSAQIAVAALFNATMLTLIGRWAMIPTWGFFIALGNASSGGAVAPPLLPPFYAFISRFVPSGASVELVRNSVYFRGAQHAEPVIVQACWLVATLTALLAVAHIRRRTPGAT